MPYGATLTVAAGMQVRAGKLLATWGPATRPIITEYAGASDSRTSKKASPSPSQIDEVTGLSTLVVIDPKRRGTSRPRACVRGEADRRKGKEVKIPAREPGQHHVPDRLDHHGEDGQEVSVGEVLARIPQETSKTRDIRAVCRAWRSCSRRVRRKTPACSPRSPGRCGSGRNKGQAALVITDFEGVAHEYLIPKEKHVMAHDGQVVNKGEIDRRRSGRSARHPATAGVEALARYISDEVQDVYRCRA